MAQALSIRGRLLQVEEDFLTAVVKGGSALQVFENGWSALVADVTAYAGQLDQETLDLAEGVSLSIAELAQSFCDLETEATSLTSDLIGELNDAFEHMTIADCPSSCASKAAAETESPERSDSSLHCAPASPVPSLTRCSSESLSSDDEAPSPPPQHERIPNTGLSHQSATDVMQSHMPHCVHVYSPPPPVFIAVNFDIDAKGHITRTTQPSSYRKRRERQAASWSQPKGDAPLQSKRRKRQPTDSTDSGSTKRRRSNPILPHTVVDNPPPVPSLDELTHNIDDWFKASFVPDVVSVEAPNPSVPVEFEFFKDWALFASKTSSIESSSYTDVRDPTEPFEAELLKGWNSFGGLTPFAQDASFTDAPNCDILPALKALEERAFFGENNPMLQDTVSIEAPDPSTPLQIEPFKDWAFVSVNAAADNFIPFDRMIDSNFHPSMCHETTQDRGDLSALHADPVLDLPGSGLVDLLCFGTKRFPQFATNDTGGFDIDSAYGSVSGRILESDISLLDAAAGLTAPTSEGGEGHLMDNTSTEATTALVSVYNQTSETETLKLCDLGHLSAGPVRLHRASPSQKANAFPAQSESLSFHESVPNSVHNEQSTSNYVSSYQDSRAGSLVPPSYCLFEGKEDIIKEYKCRTSNDCTLCCDSMSDIASGWSGWAQDPGFDHMKFIEALLYGTEASSLCQPW